MSVNVQYVGFTAKAMVREYSFLVRESSIDSHEITFTILNEAFTSHRLSLQNGPDICSLKLHRELADSSTLLTRRHHNLRRSAGRQAGGDGDTAEQGASTITSEWPTTSEVALLLFAFPRFANREQEDG